MKRLLPILTLAASAANAQCVMCFRTAAAQNMERARVMNIGIFIMMVPPFLILAGFLVLCWRRSKTYADHESDVATSFSLSRKLDSSQYHGQPSR
jgi:heme/copper-type cytochrome/quinol oxidase subunit 2